MVLPYGNWFARMLSMSDWYYAQDDQKHGPVPEAEICKLLEQGALTGDSLVWTKGMPDWLPVSKLSALASSITETAVCAVSGKSMPASQMLSYGDRQIDPAHKDTFVQQLGEGAVGNENLSITSGGYTYADPAQRAGITKWLFIGGTVLEIGMAITDFFVSSVDSESFNFADGIMALLGLGYLPVWIAGIVFYCMWKHRVCSNAYALGGMKNTLNPITPGWAVGYYFIPVLTLWKPYQAMKEIWNSSVSGEKSSAVLGLWWALWILTGVLGQISIRLTFSGQEEVGLVLDAITAGIAVPLLFAILKIIREITSAQIDRQKIPGAGVGE